MTSIPSTTQRAEDAELAYREYVAWALLFAIREAQMLCKRVRLLGSVLDALRFVSDLNDLAADNVQAGSIIETVKKLVARAEQVISLSSTQPPSN